MFFEGWVPKQTPIKERHAETFIAVISTNMDNEKEYRGADDIRCVFDLLNARLSAGEVEDVRAGLSDDVRAVWPAP